jgi:hypothetical protein
VGQPAGPGPPVPDAGDRALAIVVISGGQTGVDRAALDTAIALGIEYSGWVPKGGWAEDMEKPPGLLTLYPRLRETGSPDPAERTRLNVRDSDVTIVIAPGAPAGGTALATETAKRLSRPVFQWSPERAADGLTAASDLLAALSERPTRSPGPASGETLRINFAGPRESELPGVYSVSSAMITSLLRSVTGAAPGRSIGS